MADSTDTSGPTNSGQRTASSEGRSREGTSRETSASETASRDGAARKFPFGLVALALLGIASCAVIAWGMTDNEAVTVVPLAPVETQFTAVKVGDLVEQTSVEGTLSKGQIISLSVPASFAAARTTTTTTTTTVPASTTAAASAVTTAPAPTTTAPSATAASATTDSATAATATAPAANASASASTASASTASASTASGSTTSTGSTAASTASASAAAAPGSASGQSAATRVVTKLAAIGTVLKPGDTAFSIDGRPTVIMSGAVPAWRTIDIDSTSGIDILQLEQSLAAAGFDADGDLTVDREVDADTITAIKEWQASLDVEQTGVVALGEVIFQTTEVTVVASNSHVGAVATPGDTLLDVRSGTPYVDISTDSSWVQPGSKVTVSINGTRVQGTVVTLSSGIARVALEPSDAIRDGASARVTLSRTKATQQLLIPSSAILVSDVDGPTIRVKRGNSTETIRVTVVGSANSLAAVTTSDNTLKTGDNVATY